MGKMLKIQNQDEACVISHFKRKRNVKMDILLG